MPIEMDGKKIGSKPGIPKRPQVLGDNALGRTMGGVGPLGPDDLKLMQERIELDLGAEPDRPTKSSTLITLPRVDPRSRDKPRR